VQVTKTEAWSTYAKQSRTAARNFGKLAGLSAVVTLVCFKVWMYRWQAELFVGLTALFTVLTAFEYFNARYNERKARGEKSFTVGKEPTDQFELIRVEGFEFYERRVRLGDDIIGIRIPARKIDTLKPLALALSSDPQGLEFKFREFKSNEAVKNPKFAGEIHSLRLDTVVFVGSNDPVVAEVYFTPQSGGDAWICIWDGKTFRDLKMET
jgi:hypothetical protein